MRRRFWVTLKFRREQKTETGAGETVSERKKKVPLFLKNNYSKWSD